MSKLWIFEKPSVAINVAKHLKGPITKKDGYIETGDGNVTWCVGHILEQSPPEDYDAKYGTYPWKFEDLPIIPKEWKLRVSSLKKQQFNIIKNLIKDCSSIVNGGDEGREGQLLVDEVIYYLKCKKPVQRILLNAMDSVSIKKAVNNLKDNKAYYPLYESALGRSRADWIYGMNFSRAYTILAQKQNYKGVISIGRVQTPTLGIVVRRDEEIANFVPKDYFSISALFLDPNQPNMEFWTRWLPPGQSLESAEKQAYLDQNGESDTESEDEETDSNEQKTNRPAWLDEANRIIDKNMADQIVQKVKTAKNGIVSRYVNQPAEEQAPLPFELTGLQASLNSKYGFSAQDILNACQKLYEAGYTTYPRTDCNYLPLSQLSDVPEIMDAITNSGAPVSQYSKKSTHSLKSRAWNDSKLGEHHAIIPTRKAPNFSTLSDIEQKAYQLIAQHYVAQFFPNCKVDKAKVEISIAEERFAASGRVVKDAGWRVVFQGESANEKNQVMTLPVLSNNANVVCKDAKSEAKKTTPPPHFTDGSLLMAMQNVHRLVKDPEERKKLKAVEGIGRSATRAGIIETLFKRNFLYRQGKKVISTEIARIIINAVPKNLVDPGLTARWEQILDGIALNKVQLSMFESKQTDFVTNLLKSIENSTLPTLPASESPSYSSKSSFASKGKSGSSSGSTAKKGKKCPKCGKGVMVSREIKSGDKKGTKFMGCSNYPECKHAEWNNTKK